MKDLKSRAKIIYILLGILFIGEIGGLFYNSGVVSGVNERAEKLKIYAIAERDDATILPGDILDRNGEWLAKTTKQTIELLDDKGEKELDSKGNVKERTVMITDYSDGKAYTQLIGFTSQRSLTFSPMSQVTIGGRDDYRLMAFLDEIAELQNSSDNKEMTEEDKFHYDEIYGKGNGLYSTVDIHGRNGQSATLTIDNDLQLMVYKALKEQMDEKSIGSAVVMDVKTGEILSMVTFPTYDLNKTQTSYPTYQFDGKSTAKAQIQTDGETTNLEPRYPVSYKNPEPPGSIFKIFMAVCLIDHGMEDFTVVDTPFQIGDWPCNNAYTSKGDTINYIQALERSSNVFFAKAALELGADKIRETAEKFGLVENEFTDENEDGKDDENPMYYMLNFGAVSYNWDLTINEDQTAEDLQKLIAQTGFGQGKTELTTIVAAMITQAIANDGTLMKPYLVKNLTDANGKVVYETEEVVLSQATSKETANKVKKAMQSTAKRNSKGEVAKTFEKYQVAGKTGTAQNGDKKTTDAWFVSFAPANDPQYVVVVNECKTNKSGANMMTTVAEIYEYLFTQYQ